MQQNDFGAGEGVIRILRQEEIGRVLPHGWAIEVAPGPWYTPFLGDMVALTPVDRLDKAIVSIRAWLGNSAANAARALADSLVAEQLDMFANEGKGGKR